MVISTVSKASRSFLGVLQSRPPPRRTFPQAPALSGLQAARFSASPPPARAPIPRKISVSCPFLPMILIPQLVQTLFVFYPFKAVQRLCAQLLQFLLQDYSSFYVCGKGANAAIQKSLRPKKGRRLFLRGTTLFCQRQTLLRPVTRPDVVAYLTENRPFSTAAPE